MQNDQARNHVMIRSAFAVASASIAVSIQVGHSRESHLVTLWALLFVSCGTTIAQSVAVFDFELIDTSLEGAIRGARPDEQERLARLSDQLRQLFRNAGRFSLVDSDRTRGAGKQPASLWWLRYAFGPTHRGRTRDR